MKNAEKRQSEVNEETYKTNVTGQDEPKKQYKNPTTLAEPKTLLS